MGVESELVSGTSSGAVSSGKNASREPVYFFLEKILRELVTCIGNASDCAGGWA